MVLLLVKAVVFVCSAGVFYRQFFKNNVVVTTLVGVVAVVSFYFTSDEACRRISEILKNSTVAPIQEPLKRNSYETVVQLVESDTDLIGFLNYCPNDIYATKQIENINLSTGDSNKLCAGDPIGCFNRCNRDNLTRYCVMLAMLLGRKSDNRGSIDLDKINVQASQAIYSKACALGNALGCVNRAAGIKAGYLFGEFLRRLRPDELSKCEADTFERACRAGDSWGCTMFGLALKNGDGRLKDSASAKVAFEKSCKLATDARACSLASSATETSK